MKTKIYNHNKTGLYLILSFFLSAIVTPMYAYGYYGTHDNFPTSSDNIISANSEGPCCYTYDADNIGMFSATLHAKVDLGDFDKSDANIGFIICKEGVPSKTNGTRKIIETKDLNQDGTYSVTYEYLDSSTKYYYRSYFSIGTIYFYGEVKEFCTANIGVEFDNESVKNITCFSAKAICKLNLKDKVKLSDVYSCGFCYSTNPNELSISKDHIKADIIDSDTCISITFKGLNSNTTYYCTPYARRDFYQKIGYSYGDTLVFTTKEDNITLTGDFDETTNTITSSFILKGGAFDTSSYGVCYSQKNPEPTTSDPHVETNEIDDENCFKVRLYPANGTTYYRAYVNIDGIPRYGEIKSFNYSKEDCKEYVDLGLPSGTLWATCNIGAKFPSEFGDYFAWGETEGYHSGKTDFDIEHYKFYDKEKAGFYKYATNISQWAGEGSYDNKRVLEPEDDAATVLWGTEWRMPTLDEIEELLTYCYWRYTSSYNGSGVSGYIVYKRLDRDNVEIDQDAAFNTTCAGLYNLSCKHIFLPAAGYYHGRKFEIGESGGYKLGKYWSKTLKEDRLNYYAYYLSLGSCIESYAMERFDGRSIRPVHKHIIKECPAPQISYVNGKIRYTSNVDDVEFYGNIRCIDNKNTYTKEVDLNATYEISVYAKKDGVKSETTYAVLTWLKDEDENETAVEDIKVPSTPILISGYNGSLTISNLEEGTEVSFYTTTGMHIISEKVRNGAIHVSLPNCKGQVIIIKMGSRSGKYVVK